MTELIKSRALTGAFAAAQVLKGLGNTDILNISRVDLEAWNFRGQLCSLF